MTSVVKFIVIFLDTFVLLSINCGRRMLRSLCNLAKRLFIDLSKEFELVYKDGQYRLQNEYNPSCHLLEIALIREQVFTGNKIKDLQSVLKVSQKWILGFYHGYKKEECKYRDIDYLTGHYLGQKIDKICTESVSKTSI